MNIRKQPRNFFYLFISTLILTVGLFFSHWTIAVPTETVTREGNELALTYASEDQLATLAIKKARPAVVTVTVIQDTQESLLRFDPAVAGYRRELRTIKKEIASGTGFFVHPAGYILTNKHVVSQVRSDTKLIIITHEGVTYEAVVASRDPLNDIAILKIGGGPFPYLKRAAEEEIQIGRGVLAIGTALGKFDQSVTKGVISARGRHIAAFDNATNQTQALDDVLQTDAAINPGNSGGPLVALDGIVVGMNTAMEQGGQSIAFAIPSYDLELALDSFFEHGVITRPYLGITYQTVVDELVQQHGLPVSEGAVILPSGENGPIALGGPAEKAGIMLGDIIVTIDGERVSKSNSLSMIIRKKKPGQTVALEIIRGSHPVILKALLGKKTFDE